MNIIEAFPSLRCRTGIKNTFTGKRKEAQSAINSFFENNSIYKKKQCPLCFEEKKTFKLISKFDYQGFPCPMIICPTCGLVFQYSYLNEEALDENYQKYSLLIRGKEINDTFFKRLFDERLERFAKQRYKYINDNVKLNKDDLIVEIGCSDGVNLFPFHTEGYKTIGFDLDQQSFAPGLEKKLDLRQEDFFDWIKSSQEKPKLIILCHFLEHLPNPNAFLEDLLKETDDDVYIYIEVPGIREKTWVNERSGIIAYMQYEHLICFERSTLEYFMNKNSFETISCNEFINGLFKRTNQTLRPQIPETDSFHYLSEVESTWEKSFLRKCRNFLASIRS